MSFATEKLLKGCDSWAEIREHPEIKDEWLSSIDGTIKRVESRFQRLKLKGNPFLVSEQNIFMYSVRSFKD